MRKPDSRCSTIRSKQPAESFGGFDLAFQRFRSLHRYNQVVAQSLVRAFGVVMLEILVDSVSKRSLAEQNQSIETLEFQ